MVQADTNTELATRSVLIVSVPGQKSTGRKTEALVELVDTAPSLYDICGLPPIQGLEGVTFEPLLKQLDRPWKQTAFSQNTRNVKGIGRVMGHSIKNRPLPDEWVQGE